MVLMVGIAGYGLKNGKPNRLLYPYDPDTKACGFNNGAGYDYTDYKYMYFPVPSLSVTSRNVCVKKCPAYTDDFTAA